MRNVPWDQALDVVLQSKGLGMVRAGNMLRIAPLADLEKEREMQLARRAQEVKLAPLETRPHPRELRLGQGDPGPGSAAAQ